MVEEIMSLCRRYGQRRLSAVDNIIDWKYFDTFLPALRDAEFDLKIFYELKANLTKAQVRLLKDSGKFPGRGKPESAGRIRINCG